MHLDGGRRLTPHKVAKAPPLQLSSYKCLFALLKPYLRVFRGVSKCNLPGDIGCLQLLRNVRQQHAFEQAEMILYTALDPAIASRVRQGDFVKCLTHFNLLQTARN